MAVVLLAVGAVPGAAGAQTGGSVAGGPVVALSRLPHPIVFDGRVANEEWDSIAPLPLTLYSPVYHGTPSERTEIRLAYDDAYLYASGRFYDSEANRIRVNSLYRDRWSGDDVFALFVDSFNDNESVRRFTITPAGTRIDELLGADGRERNLSWDAPWDVATTRDGAGWYFEMRIPFSSLRFQLGPDGVIMGVTATRLIARKNERVTFPDIDPRFRFDQPSETRDVRLEGIQPRQPVYVTPYLLGGYDRNAGDPGAAVDSKGVGEAGVDAKYSLADNVFLDLSVNMDFAQVEADDQQINLSRFPLFFPEKRQFFQERSDLFLYDFAQGGRLFHSRNIGLSADRTPVRILGGARVTGRAGRWDFGVLDVQSDAANGAPGENFGVARVKRRILNPYSYTGGMVTSRVGMDGRAAAAVGLDGSVRLPADHYATVRWAATDTEDDAGASLAERTQLFVEWARRVDRGLRYWLRVDRVGSAYTPSLGFLPRSNFLHGSVYAVYNVRGQEGRWLRSYGPGVIVNAFTRNGTGQLETLYAAHWWNYEFWNGASGWLQVTHRRELVDAAFPIGDGVSIPAGDYGFTNLWFNFSSGPTSRFRTAFNARAGTFYDGRQVELIAGPTWNMSRHLEVGGEYEVNFLRFPDRGEKIDIHLARLRLQVAADVRFSATALIQYNSVADLLGINLRLRYNFGEGTDLWLVYDEGLNTVRNPGDAPALLPLSRSRALRTKLTYTFAL